MNSLTVHDTGAKQVNVLFRNLVRIPSTTYATFALYRYPAKFIPHFIMYIHETYVRRGMSVFDPFAGYGTVGVVARIYGCDYELWDLNPMLEILHSIATMEPPTDLDIDSLLLGMRKSKERFVPKWSRMEYWFPEQFLEFLHGVWGYYHSLQDRQYEKLLLTIPLLKVTRHYSYDDQQRQKLSRSRKSEQRVQSLLKTDWKETFFQMLHQEVCRIVKRLKEYQNLGPQNVKSVVKGGVDSLSENLDEERDVLITSPPYLQSQEYIRQAKLDLFWLGYSEEEVRSLGKLEIPYRSIQPYPVYSRTFHEWQSLIKEKQVLEVFNRYFWGVLGTLSRLQAKITSYLFLFVGHTSARGNAVPIDRIFVEHFSELGWRHEETLVDTIVSRRLFAYGLNPATGIKDARTPTEHLVVLRRP
jgi:hypothetical protein